MATASQFKPQVSEYKPPTRKVRVWTAGRVASLVGLGTVPVLALLLQPNIAGLATAVAVETLLAALAFRAWLSVQT